MNIIPFKIEHSVRLARLVVSRIRNRIPGIGVDPSAESGFYIPANEEWRAKLITNHFWYQYHGNDRQLRFGYPTNGIISYLHFKDDVESWTKEEVEILIDEVNNTILEFNL